MWKVLKDKAITVVVASVLSALVSVLSVYFIAPVRDNTQYLSAKFVLEKFVVNVRYSESAGSIDPIVKCEKEEILISSVCNSYNKNNRNMLFGGGGVPRFVDSTNSTTDTDHTSSGATRCSSDPDQKYNAARIIPTLVTVDSRRGFPDAARM